MRGAKVPSLALGLGLLLPAATPAEDTFAEVSRVVAVGDVHGDLAQLVTVLQDSGIIDAKRRWAGGKAHLVQVGDRLDRGGDSRQVSDLFIQLEKEAKKAGGAVHPLLGNHEAMNMLGDLRYVTPEDFAAFRGPDSNRLRDALWDKVVGERKARGEAAPTDEDRKRFDAEHPPGWVEHRLAFAPSGTYGRWLVGQNAVERIGDTLFLHGGISPKYADFGLRDLNDRIRAELRDPSPLTAVVCQDPEGPLWYRGLAQDDADLGPHVEAVLRKHGVRRIVIGHTPTPGLVLPRYGGRVVVIDVGLSKFFGGPPAALVLEGGHAFALHRGKRLELPEAEGEPLLRYVREVAALEPDPSRLRPLLDRLQAAVTAKPASR
jgi:hypothetical protein